MARLKQTPAFLGTRNGICTYTRFGNFYIRTKSSLNGERVKTAPEFKKTMEYASLLASGSKIASIVYRGVVDKSIKKYRQITGEAMKMLKDGMEKNEILNRLLLLYGSGVEHPSPEQQKK